MLSLTLPSVAAAALSLALLLPHRNPPPSLQVGVEMSVSAWVYLDAANEEERIKTIFSNRCNIDRTSLDG
jgi:hypothetical protein